MKLTNQTIVISAISLVVGLGLGTVFGVGGSYALRKATTDKTAKTETAKNNGETENTSPRIDNTPKQVGKTYTRKEIQDKFLNQPSTKLIAELGQPKRTYEGPLTAWTQYWFYDNVVVHEVTGKFETLYVEVLNHGKGECSAFYYDITHTHIPRR